MTQKINSPGAIMGFGAACLLQSGLAHAQEMAAQPAYGPVPLALIFSFSFLMLGPIKIVGPFAKITHGADATLTRNLAIRAIFFASLALLVAAVAGEAFLRSYTIPIPVLVLAAGIVLFLVALQGILQQFAPPAHPAGEPASTPTLAMAITPIAFPTIVTPYGIAAVIVFLALSPDNGTKLKIGAILLVVMALNLMAMLLARSILRVMGLVLQILGAVLGIIQVAIGLDLIVTAVKALWA
jgi:multiple antibiotic resistance protein